MTNVTPPDGPIVKDIELLKLSFDWCKHIATLSTGSILLVVTFREKLAAQPSLRGLLPLALGSFVLAILGTLGVQLDHLLEGRFFGASRVGRASAFLVIAGYLVGVAALAGFGIANLARF